VRGSTACAGPEWSRYGGNTACVEIRCGERLIILDAGTGLQRLGGALGDAPIDADILFSHTHLDHICGVPFFAPLFRPTSSFRLRAGHLWPESTLRDALASFMSPPLFPVPPAVFAANIAFQDFRAGETFSLGDDVTVRTAPLPHPNRATGYRIVFGDRSVCYITDLEHEPGDLDEDVLGLIAGADLVIYDSTYTDAEFPAHVGWGHSTWQQGVRLCEAAGAHRLAIFHHDPSHDDAFMDRVAEQAARMRPGTIVAREGAEVVLTSA
jgi:phosphoribosyl 1,2-cyclic phosphodiesterase